MFFLFQYGGGKVIRPGEQLETAEDKAAKEARTRQLIAAYTKKIGLNIDPKLKAECEQVFLILGVYLFKKENVLHSLRNEFFCHIFLLSYVTVICRY